MTVAKYRGRFRENLRIGKPMMQPGRTLDWDRMTPAERAAWQLLLSWRRGGVLVQRAFIATHVN